MLKSLTYKPLTLVTILSTLWIQQAWAVHTPAHKHKQQTGVKAGVKEEWSGHNHMSAHCLQGVTETGLYVQTYIILLSF